MALVMVKTEQAEVEMLGLMPCRVGSKNASAAIAHNPAAVFAVKGKTLQEYWGPSGGPDLIVDDGGDAKEEYEKSGKIPDPNSTEETTTGVKRVFFLMQSSGSSPFLAINVNDSVTKSKVQRTNERDVPDLETGLHGISTPPAADLKKAMNKAMNFACWVTGLSFGGIFAIASAILQNSTVLTSKLPLKASIILMVLNMFFGVASITLATSYPPTGHLVTITTVIKYITLVLMVLAALLASIPLLG